MSLPPRGASFATSIKCSNCDADIPMSGIADHICIQVSSIPMVEEPEEMSIPTQQIVPTIPPFVSRPSRPFVPRIDSTNSNRSGFHGELTPASSHSSVGHSPVSPGPGRRFPFPHPPRKASAPILKRPPSPELISQDCAFPPFPSSKTKTKTVSKNNVRGRTNTPDIGQSSRSFESDAKRSASVGAPKSRFRQGTGESSRPSTANSSRQPSLSSRSGSRQGSIDEVPPLPALQPTLSHTTTASDPEPRTLEHAATWSTTPDHVLENTVPTETSPFPELTIQENDSQDPSLQPEIPLVNNETPIDNATREPSYRAKRPPPITNLPSNNMDEYTIPKPESSPKEPPPPTPSSTLARTLTSLFGRKRNQSTSSRKGKQPATDGPRFIALSPDPDPQDVPRNEILSDNNSTHSSLNTDMVSTPPIHGIQEVPHVSTDITPAETEIAEPQQAQILQPEEIDECSRDSVQIEQEFEQSLATVAAIPRLSTVPEQSEEVKRASIDSASSYGSEGFSHSRGSSRSNNALNAHSYGSSISTARTISSEDFIGPAFTKLKNPDIVPDSSTDPYLQHGRLAPVPETTMSEEIPETNDHSEIQEASDHSEMIENVSPPVLSVPPIPDSETDYFEPPPSIRQRRPSTPGSNRGICRGCSNLIIAGQKSVSSKDGRLTGKYHKECFVCKTCQEPFATADFYVHEDHPYCSHHYHVINQTLCESCGEGIEGHYLETSNLSGNGAKKFHPHCLKCATCKIQLSDDYFEMSGRVYCEKDAFRLINGPRSPYGTAPSRPSPLNREYISSGGPGSVLAAGKFPERRLTRLMMTS